MPSDHGGSQLSCPFASPNSQESMYERVLNGIREDIFSCALRPLQRVGQDELASRFGVSRIPVRQALRALFREGLIELEHHRSAVVTEISPSHVREIYAIRKLLEGRATEIGAGKITDEELTRLRSVFAQMEMISADGSPVPQDIHNRFHFTIYAAAQAPVLTKVIVDLWPLTERYRRFYYLLPGRNIRSIELHRAILLACERRDGPAALRAMIKHLRFTEENVVRNLKREFPTGERLTVSTESRTTPAASWGIALTDEL